MIIHFTTVHPRTDTRIRVKEVATLANRFPGQVSLYVQDGLGDEVDPIEGFRIHDTGPPEQGRLRRMTVGGYRMYCAVRRARPAIAHFHDPELLPWAALLHFAGVKVIFDMHEDLPKQILHKDYLPRPIARLLSAFAKKIENLAAKIFEHIVVVVPTMEDRFSRHGAVLIANFPKLEEFKSVRRYEAKADCKKFVYVGGIASVRGISEMVDAIALVPDDRVQLQILGSFTDHRLEEVTRGKKGWSRVEFFGWSNRELVIQQLSKARAGLVLLHPTPQYLISYPVKMFEYMAAGLPVIASDFPLWREIVGGLRCGLLVDPQDPKAIADAMQWMLVNPDEADKMGRRGRAAVENRYNWGSEGEKLVKLYRSLAPLGLAS